MYNSLHKKNPIPFIKFIQNCNVATNCSKNPKYETSKNSIQQKSTCSVQMVRYKLWELTYTFKNSCANTPKKKQKFQKWMSISLA